MSHIPEFGDAPTSPYGVAASPAGNVVSPAGDVDASPNSEACDTAVKRHYSKKIRHMKCINKTVDPFRLDTFINTSLVEDTSN